MIPCVITLDLAVTPRKVFMRAFTHSCQSLWAFSAQLQRERDFPKSGLRVAAPVLEGQPCFHQLRNELGEMDLTELKIRHYM